MPLTHRILLVINVYLAGFIAAGFGLLSLFPNFDPVIMLEMAALIAVVPFAIISDHLSLQRTFGH